MQGQSIERRAPPRAWIVVCAGTAVNLCLGILYAWSIWKANLVGSDQYPAGTAMSGLNEGWTYLSDSQATLAYAVCGITFAVFMIPGGLLQDRLGPRLGTTLGGLFLGGGCILAGLGRSYLALVCGFGVLGGIGMGLGYAAATPAAVKWFGPQRRGLVAGLVVGGYGAAAIYIAPAAKFLIANYGLTGSFVGLGILFAIVIVAAAQLLAVPGHDYQPYSPPASRVRAVAGAPQVASWSASEMLGTWQFYAMLLLFVASAQSGLLVIANAARAIPESCGREFQAACCWGLIPSMN